MHFSQVFSFSCLVSNFSARVSSSMCEYAFRQNYSKFGTFGVVPRRASMSIQNFVSSSPFCSRCLLRVRFHLSHSLSKSPHVWALKVPCWKSVRFIFSFILSDWDVYGVKLVNDMCMLSKHPLIEWISGVFSAKVRFSILFVCHSIQLIYSKKWLSKFSFCLSNINIRNVVPQLPLSRNTDFSHMRLSSHGQKNKSVFLLFSTEIWLPPCHYFLLHCKHA